MDPAPTRTRLALRLALPLVALGLGARALAPSLGPARLALFAAAGLPDELRAFLPALLFPLALGLAPLMRRLGARLAAGAAPGREAAVAGGVSAGALAALLLVAGSPRGLFESAGALFLLAHLAGALGLGGLGEGSGGRARAALAGLSGAGLLGLALHASHEVLLLASQSFRTTLWDLGAGLRRAFPAPADLASQGAAGWGCLAPLTGTRVRQRRGPVRPAGARR